MNPQPRIRARLWIHITVASLLLGSAACQDTKMQAFTSTEGHFTVQMPGAVQQRKNLHQFKDGKSGYDYQFFVSNDLNHVAYMVMYNDLPSGPPAGDPQAVLLRIRDAVVTGKTLVSDSPITLNGVPGRAITARAANGTVFQLHEFLSAGRLYQLIVTAESGYTATQADAFMNSFKLT